MSATVSNAQKTLDYFSNSKNKICINPNINKDISISIINSAKSIPWSGHMASYAIEDIYSIIKNHASTIIFVNTRAQSEFIFQSLWKINKFNLNIAIHHGSLDKELRLKIEKKMFKGEINCIVATSSLELGLDWGNVDLVIQVGAPKGIIRIIQRIGRSNHNINKASKAILVPTNRFEYLECLAAKEAIKKNKIEEIPEKIGSLDVLAQHINGVACSQPFDASDLFKQVKKTWPYRNLTRVSFNSVLSFVHNGGYVLKNYKLFSRLKKNKNIFSISNNNFIKRYRMNLGTIVEAEIIPVFLKNKKLGYIEEYFINQLQKDDTFLFAGLILNFQKISQKGVEVIKSNGKHPKIPSYAGGNLPLSSFLAKSVISLIKNYNKFNLPDQILDWLSIQKRESSLPPVDGLLIETFKRNRNNYIVSYTFQGRNANQTLGVLIMQKLEEYNCQPLAFVASDYALAVWSVKKFKNIKKLFNSDLLKNNFNNWLKNTSILKKHFKSVAVISGLIDKKLPGKLKTHKQVNFSSNLIYDVLEKYERNHILIKATRDEALNDMIKFDKLKAFIKKIQHKIRHNELRKISPFAIPIVMEFYSEKISHDKIIRYETDNIEQELIKEAYNVE